MSDLTRADVQKIVGAVKSSMGAAEIRQGAAKKVASNKKEKKR